MLGAGTYRVPYDRPRTVWQETLADPVRLIQILLSTFMLGYGAREENRSPFTMKFLEAFLGSTFSAQELFLITILLLEVIRRIVYDDWRLYRSPMSRPVLGLFLTAVLIPYLRMLLWQGFKLPMELLLLPEMLVVFFVFLFIFRPSELRFMAWMIAICGLYKAIEGVAVYATFGLKWGLLTGWRDAMLQSMTVVGGILAVAIKPGEDRIYRRLRTFLITIFPLAVWSFMASNRRSYMLGIIAALPVIYFVLERGERKRMGGMVVALVGMAAASLVLVGSAGFLIRLQGLQEPVKEESAFNRLAENINVLHEIAEEPIVGYPMTKGWGNYTIFPQFDHPEEPNVVLHNSYLYIWWRGGIVALFCWLWLLATMARMTYRGIRAAERPMDRFIAYWLFSIPFIVSITAVTSPAWGDRLQVYFPFLWVMASYLPGVWSKPLKKRAADLERA
jgi:hypothetical protein